MWLEPFGRSRDLLGLGGFVGDPSDPTKGTESGLELFYRFQLHPGGEHRPRHPVLGPERRGLGTTDAWIAGLRVAFQF
jgi:hypothetical protein